MTRGWENPCMWANSTVWTHIHPTSRRLYTPESTPTATTVSPGCQLTAPGSGGVGGTVIPQTDPLVLLHAKVFGSYTLANLNRLFHSIPGTESSLGWGLWPQEYHSKPLINPFLIISPVPTVCFSLLLSRSVTLQACLLLSKEAKESYPRKSLFLPESKELVHEVPSLYPSSAASEGTSSTKSPERGRKRPAKYNSEHSALVA